MPAVRDLSQSMTDLYGEAGREWLSRLPGILAAFAEEHGLTLGAPFEGVRYSYVVVARMADGSAAVVKAVPPNPEFSSEVEALRWFGGLGAARLIAADTERGIALVERLVPGTPLQSVENDDRAMRIAADVMRALWKPAPAANAFRSVAQWGGAFRRLRDRFDGASGPLPEGLVQTAESLFAELLRSARDAVVLHGDLHHGNVLASGTEWRAIDPKGVVGEAAYEVGALLRNPMPDLLERSDVARVLARRVDLLVERLGLDRQRLVDWSRAQAVLAGLWSFEDHGSGWEPWLHCAQLLNQLPGTKR